MSSANVLSSPRAIGDGGARKATARLEVVRRARLDVREHRLGVLERLVPAAELERGARELATGPPRLPDVAVASHGLVVPLLELIRPSQVDTGVPPGEVVERAGERQGRVRGLRKLDRELEVGIAAGLSEVITRGAQRGECVGADRVEAEIGGHPFSFPAGVDRVAPAAVEHRESRGLPERPCHRSRGRTSAHELDSATRMCVDSRSIAGAERDLRQQWFPLPLPSRDRLRRGASPTPR